MNAYIPKTKVAKDIMENLAKDLEAGRIEIAEPGEQLYKKVDVYIGDIDVIYEPIVITQHKKE